MASERLERERLFDALWDEHRRALHAYFLGRTGDRELALDLLQDLFLRVWRSLPNLAALPPDRWRFWIFSVARNLVTDSYRAGSARSAAEVVLDPLLDLPDRSSVGPEAALVDRDQLAALDRAIQRLPDDLRVVLVLHVVGERSSAQIGEMLGKPAGTVRYQLAMARQRLAAELGVVEAAGQVSR